MKGNFAVPPNVCSFGHKGEGIDLSTGYVETDDAELAGVLQSHGFERISQAQAEEASAARRK